MDRSYGEFRDFVEDFLHKEIATKSTIGNLLSNFLYSATDEEYREFLDSVCSPCARICSGDFSSIIKLHSARGKNHF